MCQDSCRLRDDPAVTKLPVLSSKKVIQVLRKAGFVDAPKRGKGSHVALVKPDQEQTRFVIGPEKDSIPKGTLIAILNQSGLTKAQFVELLNQ